MTFKEYAETKHFSNDYAKECFLMYGESVWNYQQVKINELIKINEKQRKQIKLLESLVNNIV